DPFSTLLGQVEGLAVERGHVQRRLRGSRRERGAGAAGEQEQECNQAHGWSRVSGSGDSDVVFDRGAGGKISPSGTFRRARASAAAASSSRSASASAPPGSGAPSGRR